MSLRKTNYDDVPAQTQSFGRNDIVLPMEKLFAETCSAIMAEGLETLLQGTNVPGDPNAMVRRCEAAPDDIIKIPRLGTALPTMLKLNHDQLDHNAKSIADLQHETGQWRSEQGSRREQCVDNHVSSIMQRLAMMTRLLCDKYGYIPAITLLRDLQEKLLAVRSEKNESVWNAKDANHAANVADTLMRFHEIGAGKSKLILNFTSRFSKDDKSEIDRVYQSALNLLTKRHKQLRNEAVVNAINKLLDQSVAGTIPDLMVSLKKEGKRVREIVRMLRATTSFQKPPASTTWLVDSIHQKVDGDATLEPSFKAAFTMAGCGVEPFLKALSHGLTINGRVVGPSDLAKMDAATAAKSLTDFGRDFFAIAIPDVMKIDFGHPELQLTLANQTIAMIRKGQPYLTFEKIQGAVEKYESYLFCNSEFRPAIESYLNGRVRFANSADDQRFHLKEKHVISFCSSVLGAGHARLDYYRGLYRRARLIAQGKFESIHDLPEDLAFPLAISERPDEVQDSRDLFDLAATVGVVTEFAGGGESGYMCYPMDETIKPRFTQLVCERRLVPANLIREYLAQGWFHRCIHLGFPSLDENLIRQLNEEAEQITDEQIASRLCELKIMEHTPGGYRFGKVHSGELPLHDLLFQYRSSNPRPLSRETFIDAMMQHDDLYTRVLFDVVMEEAKGNLAEHQLPDFAQQVARKWKN